MTPDTDSSDAATDASGTLLGPHDEAVLDLLRLLGRAHALAVLYVFATDPGPWRFGELADRLDISPNTLSQRLTAFEQAGLVTRRSFDEIPPRVEYTATERAADLKPAFTHLYRWVSEHDVAPEARSDDQ